MASSASRRSPSIEKASRKAGSTSGRRSESNAASLPATARSRNGASAGGPNADPTDEVIHRAEDRDLLRAVLALPFKDRQAIYLHYFDGLTFAEIGEVVGASEIAARVRVHRALQRLRGRLGPDSVAREVPA